MIVEFNEKMQDMKQINEENLKEKNELEDKVNSLKRSNEEIAERYEHKLRIKDDELLSRTQRELKEFQAITETIKDLETKLRSSDDHGKTSQKSLEEEKAKNREYEQTIESYQSKLNMNEERINSMNKTLELYENVQGEMKEEIKNLRDENEHLKDTIALFEENKKAFEIDFREKVSEIEQVVIFMFMCL